MWQAKQPGTRIPRTTEGQTNKDRGSTRRAYRLSAEGAASLRAAALRNQPWRRSTGPRTAAGKARSRANATKHGERSAGRLGARRELNAVLRLLSDEEGHRHAGLGAHLTSSAAAVWLTRIEEELRPCR